MRCDNESKFSMARTDEIVPNLALVASLCTILMLFGLAHRITSPSTTLPKITIQGALSQDKRSSTLKFGLSNPAQVLWSARL
jgi:hypothetical protein